MIVLVIASPAEFHIAQGNPKKGISVQETVILPELWGFFR
jgi:hypothetical protein